MIQDFPERGGQNQDLRDSQDEQDFDELSCFFLPNKCTR